MKRFAPVLLLAGLFGGAAHAADTNVTLYGIADVSIRYINHGGDEGHSRLGMNNGAISNSRWGLRGTEDLGDGNKAFFRLESGFDMQNGKETDRFFNRYAYVGVDGGEIGAISLGRQDTPLFTILADTFDPLTVGNYTQNSWLPVSMSRARSDNTVRYRNDKLGGFDLILSYSFNTDSVADNFKDHKAGQQYGGTLSYTDGPFQVGGGYQLTRDSVDSDKTQRVWNFNAAYKFDTVKLFAGYFNGRDETGWVNVVNSDGRFGGGAGLERKDQGFFLGATWQATHAWTLTGAGYYDRSKNLAQDGDKGRRWALVGVAEYALSKRTQVYGTVDYNKVNDAAEHEIAGSTSQLGVAMGIRHIF